jgi:predicted nucleotidyltransferase
MKSREEVMTILRDARHDLQTRFPNTRMAFFGSYARGEQYQESDAGIFVVGNPPLAPSGQLQQRSSRLAPGCVPRASSAD